ncbi:MAG: hypothetical protein ACRCR4_03610 [Thiotrichaceae bacterium]|uniref:Uncharacterized protein n=1 Tax=Candidatus Thiocaldithrix dubininis TaxID=3080823 RepID=A0AA95HB88_9GAMM|nr:MAG: hypothetical protein QJT80_03410 [Candidatus Thiocaldithrix dubininis]
MRGVLTVFFLSSLSLLNVHADEAAIANTQQSLSVSSQVKIVVNIPVRTQLTLDAQQLNAQVNTQQGAVVSEALEDNASGKQMVYTATSL